MHLFTDLQPYICTFTDCRDELAQFSSRAAWAAHEFSRHRTTRSWTCPECPQDFPDVSGWENHLQERHRLFFSGPNLRIAKSNALRIEARQIKNDECPLCRIVVGKPRRGFVKHVGRHMEEIALMALPRNVEEDTEEASTSTDHTSLEQGSQRFHPEPPIEKDKEEISFDPDVAPIRATSEGRFQKASPTGPLDALADTAGPPADKQRANELTPEDDGYHPATQDREGERKLLPAGELLVAGQTSALRTFSLQHRDEGQFMLATDLLEFGLLAGN